jgi:CRISPR-associated protein Csm3
MAQILTLYDKIEISGAICLQTGLHIGGSSEFSPIGALDNIVVRDSLTQEPIIPATSLKGKLRFLLARLESKTGFIPEIKDESLALRRLFGCGGKEETIPARLQFIDSRLTSDSIKKLTGKTDLYLTEIKFENTISRTTCVANPRQVERIPAGAEFEFKIIYNMEIMEAPEISSDFQLIGRGLKLLQEDYLGGSGSRGYGRVEFKNVSVHALRLTDKLCPVSDEELTRLLKEQ